MKTEFVGFGLRETLLQALEELDFQKPTPVQEACIPPMMEGRDIIAQARTGTGKTAAFALPVLQNLIPGSKATQVLILSPTRELAKQVGQNIEDYSKHENTTVLTIYGGSSYGYQKSMLRKGVNIVVGTPGRLLDLIKQGNLKLDQVNTLVLDEADEMLSMGFSEELDELISHLPEERQTALFSATIPREIKRLVDKATNNPVRVNLSQEVSTSNVDLAYFTVRESDKIAAVSRLFETEQVTAALIFCRTRAQTGTMAAELTRRGIAAESLSGAMEQDAREMVLRRFRKETFSVLVATDVAARGLDIDHLSHVVNLDLPQSPDVFVHRIGRVGRAGRKGVAFTLITPKEDWKLKRIERALKRTIEPRKVPSKKDITRGRIEKLYTKLNKWLESDRCKKEIAWVEELQAAGYDSKKIAAAALKLAMASEKEQPIAEMSEDDFSQKMSKGGKYSKGGRFDRGGRGRRDDRGGRHDRDRGGGKRDYHNRGDGIQLMAQIGKAHGLNPKEILVVLTQNAKLPSKAIGNIRISKTRTFVDIDQNHVERVMKANGSYKIGKRKFNFQLA